MSTRHETRNRTLTILIVLLALIAAGVAGAAKSWATGNPHTKVLEWTLPNGGTPQNVTWPQTPYAGECGVWIQVDVYPYKTDADKARTDALDDDGLLTRGEDHGWVKSWSFRQAPPCTAPTPTPEPTWTPTPTTSPTPTPSPSSTPSTGPTHEPTPGSPQPSHTPTAQPTSEPSSPAPTPSTSSSPASTTVASASPTATPGTPERVELAATGVSAPGFIAGVLTIVLGAFCVGISRRRS